MSDKKNLTQKILIRELLNSITEQDVEDWKNITKRARAKNNDRFTEDDEAVKQWKKENQVGIKIYCHRGMRTFMNEYSNLLETTTSDLIKTILIDYFLNVRDNLD